MEIDASYHLNSLENRRAFRISSLVSAIRFFHNPIHTPYKENYNFAQILLVLEGSGTYTTEHSAYPMTAGRMIYRPAYRTSQYEWHSERVHYALISFVCNSPAMDRFGVEPLVLNEEERGTLHDLIKTASRVCEPFEERENVRGFRFKSDTPDAVLGFIAASLERFLSMLYCRLESIDLLLDESQKVSAYLDGTALTDRVKQYLAANMTRQLSVDEVCRAFGVSQTALLRKFRRDTDRSLMDYFTELKITEAKYRIAKTSQSFTEIAEALGFSSVNYFSKVFKARVGMTPTEYSRHASKRRAGG